MKPYIVNKDHRITIPRKICARLGVKPGDQIQIESTPSGSLKLIPVGKPQTRLS